MPTTITQLTWNVSHLLVTHSFLKPREVLSKPAPDFLIPYQVLHNLASVVVDISYHPCESAHLWETKSDLLPRKSLHRPHVLHVHSAEIKHRNACAQEECLHSVALSLPAIMHFLFTYWQMQSPGLPFTSTALELIHHHHTLAHASARTTTVLSQSHLPSQCAL